MVVEVVWCDPSCPYDPCVDHRRPCEEVHATVFSMALNRVVVAEVVQEIEMARRWLKELKMKAVREYTRMSAESVGAEPAV